MTPRLRARATVEGAFLAAVAAVLFLAQETIPLLGIVLAVFCPAPLVYMTVRHGLRAAALTLLTAAVLLGMVSLVWALLFASTFGVLGLCLGEVLRRRYSWGVIIAFCSIVVLATLVATYGISRQWLRADPLLETIRLYDASFTQAIEQQEQLPDITDEQREVLAEARRMHRFTLLAIPATFSLAAMFVVTLNVFACRWLLKRIGMVLTPLPPLARFRCYDACIWGMIAGLGLLLQGQERFWFWLLGLNLTVFFAVLYTFQGMTIIVFYFRRWRVHMIVRIVGYFLAVTKLWPLVVSLGVFDTWFDFRRSRRPAAPPPVPGGE